MGKKLLLLTLTLAVAAMTVLPASASATPWHTTTTGAFTVQGNGSVLWSTASGITFVCDTVTGVGNYTTTTGGTVDLKFGTCWAQFATPVHCTTPGQPSGNITTTALRFDNVMLGTGKPGVLLTPNAETGAVAHFNCGGLPFTVEGNGLLGTVTAPACGVSSTSATWSFSAIAHGAPQHTLYTGTAYNWKRSGENIAVSMEATVKFPVAKTPICT